MCRMQNALFLTKSVEKLNSQGPIGTGYQNIDTGNNQQLIVYNGHCRAAQVKNLLALYLILIVR